MVEGVRVLPWLVVHERLENKSVELFDCEKCRRHYPREERRERRCGYIPVEQWIENHELGMAPRILMLGDIEELETCPGFTTKLPEVLEVARAWSWWNKGQLVLRYREPSERVMDLIELFHASNAGAEKHELEQRSKGSQ